MSLMTSTWEQRRAGQDGDATVQVSGNPAVVELCIQELHRLLPNVKPDGYRETVACAGPKRVSASAGEAVKEYFEAEAFGGPLFPGPDGEIAKKSRKKRRSHDRCPVPRDQRRPVRLGDERLCKRGLVFQSHGDVGRTMLVPEGTRFFVVASNRLGPVCDIEGTPGLWKIGNSKAFANTELVSRHFQERAKPVKP